MPWSSASISAEKDNRRAGEAVSQLLLAAVLFSCGHLRGGAAGQGHDPALTVMSMAEVEDDVMAACVTYLRISAYSYPAHGRVRCGGGPLPQLRQDQHHHVPLHRCPMESMWRATCIGVFCAESGGGRRGLALPALPECSRRSPLRPCASPGRTRCGMRQSMGIPAGMARCCRKMHPAHRRPQRV